MTDQTALRVANQVCVLQRQAAAKLIAHGVAPERVEFFASNYGGQEHNICGVTVDGAWVAHVRWTDRTTPEGGTVEIELTWADAWAHLDRAAA